MLHVGLREANMHFSKYLKLVREGQEVVVTERGTPVAVIKPVMKEGHRTIRSKVWKIRGYCEGLLKGSCRLAELLRLPESLYLKP